MVFNMEILKEIEPSILRISGGGFFALEIVGTSFYQEEIESICGLKTSNGHCYSCVAMLICENDNEYDEYAVKVEIQGKKIGYLPKIKNKFFREELNNSLYVVECPALIVGGWKDFSTEGNYGVKIDLPYRFLRSSEDRNVEKNISW